MSNQQRQPADPPTEGAGAADNPPGQGQRGTAHGQEQQDAAAWPTNDRQATETAANKVESDKT